MSGSYGGARKGKIKLVVKIRDLGTSKTFSSHIFVRIEHQNDLTKIVNRINKKYPYRTAQICNIRPAR